MVPKMQIGSLLVEAGIISATTLERSLELQKGSGKRLGALLRDIGIVTEEEVLEALARQCSTRVVRNFANHDYPKELLALIPARLALEKIIFPLKVYQDMLAIATLDPFDRDTFEHLAATTGKKIHLALATRDDILAAIKRHYTVEKWAQGGRQKIVIIDPSPIVTNFLKSPLEKEGYEVLVSHDGVDGLELASSSNPDIIVCDLMMPRMDGYDFIKALRLRHDALHVPVILMSSKNSPEEEHLARKAGFAGFIAKPAMPARVLVTIKKALAIAGNRNRAMESDASQPVSNGSPSGSVKSMLRARHGRH